MNAIVECEACHFQWLTKPLIIDSQPWPDSQDRNCHACPSCGLDGIKMLGFSQEPYSYRCPNRGCRSTYILMHITAEFRIVMQPNGEARAIFRPSPKFDDWSYVKCGVCGRSGCLYEFNSMNQYRIPIWYPEFKSLGVFNMLILGPTRNLAWSIRRETIILELGAPISKKNQEKG